MEFVWQLVIIIVATKLAGDISVRLGQPSVLGKLIIGVVIGPASLGWIEQTTVIETFSYIGVLLLMFLAGLETDLKELNRNRTPSIAVAVGGIVVPFATGYVLGEWFGLHVGESLFLGLLLSATSVSISVQTFKELGKFKSKESATVLGAALVDDILVVIFLAVLMSILTTSDVSLPLLIGKKALFFILAGLLAWKVVPWMMRWFAKLKINEPIMSAAMVICLSFAVLAESFGVAGIIGAFAAGVAISRTRFKTTIEHKLEPIAYAVFVPVFFVSIGLAVSFNGFLEHWVFTTVLTIGAILSKWVGAGLGARITGFNARSSLVIGAGMISRGEVALIIASIGLSSGLLPKDYFTSIVIAIIVSTIAAPPILKRMFK